MIIRCTTLKALEFESLYEIGEKQREGTARGKICASRTNALFLLDLCQYPPSPMTDYPGEQAMEIEALEAILMDDLQIFDATHPDGWNVVGETYIVAIDSREDGEEEKDENVKEMEFVFGHTEKYPDEPPCMRLRVLGGLSTNDSIEGMIMLNKEAQENLGMPMIFQLVTAAKEWIRAKTNSIPEEDPDAVRRKASEEEEARRAAIRAHGTRVTVENFAEWKRKFDAERAVLMAQTEAVKDEEKAGPLSEDDEQDFHRHDGDDEEDFDYEDDDDEGMLENLVEQK
eukprot:gene3477-13540_t